MTLAAARLTAASCFSSSSVLGLLRAASRSCFLLPSQLNQVDWKANPKIDRKCFLLVVGKIGWAIENENWILTDLVVVQGYVVFKVLATLKFDMLPPWKKNISLNFTEVVFTEKGRRKHYKEKSRYRFSENLYVCMCWMWQILSVRWRLVLCGPMSESTCAFQVMIWNILSIVMACEFFFHVFI